MSDFFSFFIVDFRVEDVFWVVREGGVRGWKCG